MARHRRDIDSILASSAPSPGMHHVAAGSGRHRRPDADDASEPWRPQPAVAAPVLFAPIPRGMSDASAPATCDPEPTAPTRAGRLHGAHRRPAPSASGRFIAISVAAGAIFSAAATSAGTAGGDTVVEVRADAAPPQILGERSVRQPQPVVAELVSHLRTAERAAAEARRPRAVLPTVGMLTSGYGPRWGSTHNGLDIANRIGTPVLAVTDGEVIEAGPADGFGLWVRVRQDDGTVGIYGHIDASLVVAGQRIQAGQQIATMGNRGQSTGPHLHYEVWQSDGTKLDPAAWLLGRGVFLPGITDTNS